MAFHEINKLLGEWNGGMPHHLIASRYVYQKYSTSPLGLLTNHHARSGLEASQRCKHSDRIALPELVNKFNVEKRSCFTLVIVNSACITFDADAAEAHTMFTYSKAKPPAMPCPAFFQCDASSCQSGERTTRKTRQRPKGGHCRSIVSHTTQREEMGAE